MHGDLKKLILSTLFTVIFFATVGVLFNNCSSLKQNQSMDTALMTNDEVMTALQKTHQESLSQKFCEQSTNYSCSQKVFSPHVKDESYLATDSECVQISADQKLCPTLTKFHYNTQKAISTCEQTAGCSDNYDYTEYDCHLKLSLKADGHYPLTARESSAEQALQKLFQQCLSLTAGAVHE